MTSTGELLTIPPPNPLGPANYHESPTNIHSQQIINATAQASAMAKQKKNLALQQAQHAAMGLQGSAAPGGVSNVLRAQSAPTYLSHSQTSSHTGSHILRGSMTTGNNTVVSSAGESEEDRGYTSGPGGLIAESVHLTQFRSKMTTAAHIIAHEFEQTGRSTVVGRMRATHYQMPTEITKIRQCYDDEEHSLIGGMKEDVTRHLPIRRPISAPHST
jgi:hypothetical protein